MTFEPHPDRTLYPERARLNLTDLEERIMLIEALGVDHLIILTFDRALASVPAEDFMARICRAMQLGDLVVGPDFRLGAGGRGAVPVLERVGQELGYRVHTVASLTLDGLPISSTRVRQLLAEARVDHVPQLLGRPFTLRGIVVHGDHRGRTIGFPTANLGLSVEQFIPGDGVYACRVLIDGETAWRPAVTNIGVRPTFGTLQRTVEAHLLDWTGDLYDMTIRLAFVQRLRGEQKFPGIDALIAQIQADATTARELLAASDTDEF
jgi:riboflavin kinase/FMN adenylyltransferase